MAEADAALPVELSEVGGDGVPEDGFDDGFSPAASFWTVGLVRRISSEPQMAAMFPRRNGPIERRTGTNITSIHVGGICGGIKLGNKAKDKVFLTYGDFLILSHGAFSVIKEGFLRFFVYPTTFVIFFNLVSSEDLCPNFEVLVLVVA